MIKIRTILAASVAYAVLATPAVAQEYNGTSGSAVVGAPVNGTATTTTDDSASPTVVVTTTYNQSVTSTTNPTNTINMQMLNGLPIIVRKTVSGSGTAVTEITEVQNYTSSGSPPTLTPNGPMTSTSAPVSNTVTAVSVSGSAGLNSYVSSLSSSGTPDANGSVVATENASFINSSGMFVEERVGTATYNSSTGQVTVALPTAATSRTAIAASGISTTGTISSASLTTGAISATSLDMNGGKITNLGAGTVATDAVNLGQLNAAVATINSSITGLAGTVSTLADLVDANRKRSDAGIAVATALSGGTFLPGKRFNLTGNIGAYRGEVAGSLQIGALITENVALNAGVATSFNDYGGTAVRGGFTVGF